MMLKLLTDRLQLTSLVDADIDISIELWTDPNVVKYICDAETEEEIRAGMPDSTRRGCNGCIGIWCVADRVTSEKYGSAYLLPLPIEEDDYDFSRLIPDQLPEGDIELGYFLKPSAWGKGYATEIARRLLEFAFRESPLEELVASVHHENLASKKVLEKSGFIYSGRTLCYGAVTPIYRISRAGWDDMRRSSSVS
jgi:RimJ/RimL family protein N-acetyltransferase